MYSQIWASIITETDTKSDAHNNDRQSPAKEVENNVYLLGKEHNHNHDEHMYSFNEHPGEGDQEEVVYDSCKCGAEAIWWGNSLAIHSNQEHQLCQQQGEGKLAVNFGQITLHSNKV